MDLKAILRAAECSGSQNEPILGMVGDHIGELTEMFSFRRRGRLGGLAGRGRKFEPPHVGCYKPEGSGSDRQVCVGHSVVKDFFTTDGPGNRQGFLDSSNAGRFDDRRRVTEALEADREDVEELEAAEKKLLGKREGQGE